ncbi:hypothetical protein [Streptomyces mangrovisoli]|uniref:Uncharacterized protein n=1 Tax=Streptomyces mangrovisoli TaxID=1428628 RepID=A0A1J4NUU4_9ACTN|nr:hypothetical protein [Streptomyces mangrovisoli]OIJ65858.1 hypothetical protein WN71_021665 [Streptomyces mangrovisoli]
MAFGVEELRVLRRALALALHPEPASAEDVQDCRRLAESLDEAMREGARLRAFLVADLARYRAALPGTAAGYFALLEETLASGYRPVPDDLAALRALRGNPVAAGLLARCQVMAEEDVRGRLARGQRSRGLPGAPAVPASRTRLLALPGGREPVPAESVPAEPDARVSAAGPARDPEERPAPKPGERPAERPAPPSPQPAQPSRPVPTPGEVFPRRRPGSPPSQRLAAG